MATFDEQRLPIVVEHEMLLADDVLANLAGDPFRPVDSKDARRPGAGAAAQFLRDLASDRASGVSADSTATKCAMVCGSIGGRTSLAFSGTVSRGVDAATSPGPSKGKVAAARRGARLAQGRTCEAERERHEGPLPNPMRNHRDDLRDERVQVEPALRLRTIVVIVVVHIVLVHGTRGMARPVRQASSRSCECMKLM